MNLHHEAVLADIERRVRTPGATLDEVDAAIAAELDVPAECYYAYLLVWGAIEAYRQLRALTDPSWTPPHDASIEGLERCQALMADLGWHGATIYQQAADLEPLAGHIADHAGKVLGAVLQLRQHLRDLQAALPGAADSDGGQAVRS